MKICPKCKRKTDGEQCAVCQLVFAEYEQRKQQETAQVYKLISSGELEQAKELAQTLSNEFPDSKGDFILLISNINRDLNIAGKYRQAQELFDQGEYQNIVLILRNLKAFDPGLSEKVISLRRKAQRRVDDSNRLQQAATLFAQQDYDAARKLLRPLKGGKYQQDAEELLAKIAEVKKGLLKEVLESLGGNFFNAARARMQTLIKQFPEAEQEQAAVLALLAKRRKISETLAAAATKAKQEKRYLEAKALYFFLSCQDPDLRPSLLPVVEEIGPQYAVSLMDSAQEELAATAELGILTDTQGALQLLPETGRSSEQTAHIAPVLIIPASTADFASHPVDIDGEEVADFA